MLKIQRWESFWLLVSQTGLSHMEYTCLWIKRQIKFGAFKQSKSKHELSTTIH